MHLETESDGEFDFLPAFAYNPGSFYNPGKVPAPQAGSQFRLFVKPWWKRLACSSANGLEVARGGWMHKARHHSKSVRNCDLLIII